MEDICVLLARYFDDNSGWDDGHTWPSVVKVNNEIYSKKTTRGSFGDIDNSYYVKVKDTPGIIELSLKDIEE